MDSKDDSGLAKTGAGELSCSENERDANTIGSGFVKLRTCFAAAGQAGRRRLAAAVDRLRRAV